MRLKDVWRRWHNGPLIALDGVRTTRRFAEPTPCAEHAHSRWHTYTWGRVRTCGVCLQTEFARFAWPERVGSPRPGVNTLTLWDEVPRVVMPLRVRWPWPWKRKRGPLRSSDWHYAWLSDRDRAKHRPWDHEARSARRLLSP